MKVRWDRCQRCFRLASTLVLILIFAASCASYVTPGRGVVLSSMSESDARALLDRRPASPFPATLVLARVQSPDYRSYGNEGYGRGRYSVLTTRDIEEERHLESPTGGG